MNQVKIKSTFAGILFAVFLGVQLNAQTIQRGKVVLQNSGHKSLPGTQVTAYGAQPTDTDNDGLFQLNFDKAESGDMTPLKEAYKKGYELVNKQETEKWILSDTKEMIIVMCPEGALKEAREKYYQIGTSTYVHRYENALSELDKQKESNRLTEKEYADKLETAYNELEKSQNLLHEYADMFSRINKDDLNELETKAFQLLERGKLDEAIALYENEKLLDKLNVQIGIEKTATEEFNEMIPSLKRYAEICVFAGGKENIDKASEIYRTVAEADMNNFENILTYGVFLEKQNDYRSAIDWFSKALSIASSKEQIAKSFYQLGEANDMQNNNEESEKSYKQSLEIYAALEPDDNTDRYKSDHAIALRGLGSLYMEMNRYDDALAYYYQASNMITPLLMSDSVRYIPVLVDLYNNIGVTSSIILRDVSSIDAQSIEKLLLQANDLSTWIVGKDSIAYIELNINTQIAQGFFYRINKDFDKAEAVSLSAIKVIEYQYSKQPDNARAVLSDVYNHTAGVYKDMKQFNLSEEFFLKSLDLREYLADNNPNAFLYKLARSHAELGDLYMSMFENRKAEQHLLKFKEIVERIVERDPDVYMPDLIASYSELGMNYYYSGDNEKAEKYYLEAIRHVKENANLQLDNTLESIYGNLALLYKNTKNYEKARYYIMESLSISKKLYDNNNEAFSRSLILTYNNLASILLSMDDFSGANKYMDEAIELCESLVKKHPDVYLPDLALMYHNNGSILQSLRKGKQVETSFEKSIQIYNDLIIKDSKQYKKGLIIVSHECGIFYVETKKYKESEALLKKTLQLNKDLITENSDAGYELIFNSYYSLIYLYHTMKDNKEFSKYVNEYIDFVKNNQSDFLLFSNKNIDKITNSFRDVLNILYVRDQNKSILDLSISAIDLYMKFHINKLEYDKNELLLLCRMAGNAYYEMEDYDSAKNYLEQYFRNTPVILEKENVNELIYYIVSGENLSLAYAELGNFELAAAVTKEVIRVSEFIVLHSKEISPKSIKTFKEVLAIFEELNSNSQ